MKITEKKEVTRTTVEEVITGRKCDVCGRPIEKKISLIGYNYFRVHTWHNDWGYDSVDSHEYYDACCDECAVKFASKYLHEAWKEGKNSKGLEIVHVNALQDGASDFLKGD